jgi:hypothetical protein
MRKEPEFFGEQELVLIYVAKRLKEALKLEGLLTEQAVDYLVEPDTYSGGIIFRTQRVGAFFYVTPEADEQARRVLTGNGFRPHELQDTPKSSQS